jgi:ADP-heptose:LPS heptosyltransferase
VRRTVVLHPGALGDVLLAIPALRRLRAPASGHEVVLAAQPRVGRLLAALSVIDRPLDFDALGLDTLFSSSAPAETLRRLLAGARVVSWFGSRDAHFSGRLRSLASETVVASSAPSEPFTVWRHLLATVTPLEADVTGGDVLREPIAMPESFVDAGRRALADAGWEGAGPLVILHPGAGGVAKRWAVAGFARVAEVLVRTLGARVVVHQGPADRDAVAALRDRLRVPLLALVEPALETLAGAIRHAALWIGNDSGVTHLAAAVGVPTLALFMAANLAWQPWAREARVRVVGVDALTPTDVDAVMADAGELIQAHVAGGHQ